MPRYPVTPPAAEMVHMGNRERERERVQPILHDARPFEPLIEGVSSQVVHGEYKMYEVPISETFVELSICLLDVSPGHHIRPPSRREL